MGTIMTSHWFFYPLLLFPHRIFLLGWRLQRFPSPCSSRTTSTSSTLKDFSLGQSLQLCSLACSTQDLQYTCKPPYLAVQQLCGGGCSCQKPLCTSPVIHVQPYWTISPPFFGARGKALPALVLPYVGSKPTLRTGLGTPSMTFCCGDRVKLPRDSGIVSVSP